jgi:uncharacterized protein
MSTLESLGSPEQSTDFARLVNDGMADLMVRYPDHFAGFLASLPMNAPAAGSGARIS